MPGRLRSSRLSLRIKIGSMGCLAQVGARFGSNGRKSRRSTNSARADRVGYALYLRESLTEQKVNCAVGERVRLPRRPIQSEVPPKDGCHKAECKVPTSGFIFARKGDGPRPLQSKPARDYTVSEGG